MKIYFEEIDEGWNKYITVKYRPYFYWEEGSYHALKSTSLKEEEIDILSDHLKHMFISIISDKRLKSSVTNHYTCYYSFTDPADEAAFVMLTHDGLDI
jgi:hypothetical protein